MYRLKYKTIILPVVLYGCETWSLTLREEHRLKVFENRVLRRIFGPKRDEVTGDWRVTFYLFILYFILYLTLFSNSDYIASNEMVISD
jgi:hypothetical protein